MLCFRSNVKRKRKSILCKVILLDETQVIHELKDTCRGQDLMEVLCKHLNLLETAYFGLRFVDKENQTHWLNLNRRISKELEGCPSFTLYFGVKFYAVDPCKLLEEITRYQFFLQLKQDILHSRLPVPVELIPELFALVVQSELGDYDPDQHLNGYVSEFRFIPNQSRELEARVTELHKRLVGQVPAASEMSFLERIKWLDLYGADLHPVLGKDNMEYFIGLIPSGVAILRNKTSVANYSWSRIIKFYRKGKCFLIKVCEKNDQEKTVGFELPTEAACKHLESCFQDQQTFFSIAGRDVRKSTSLLPSSQRSYNNLSLSQRFRGSFTARRHALPDKDQLQSNILQVSRPAPTVVRVPSRRYQRRLNNESVESKENHSNELKNSQEQSNSLVFSKQQYTANVKTGEENLSWDKQSGLFTGKSPYDEDRSVARRRSSSRSRYSDNESSVSRSSRQSHQSCRSHRSQCRHRHRSHSRSRDDRSGDESECSGTSSKRRRHRRRHRCNRSESNDQLVDSQPQWLKIQKYQQEQAALVKQTVSQSVIKKTNEASNASTYQDQCNQQETLYSNGHITPSVVLDNAWNQALICSSDSVKLGLPANYAPPRPIKTKKFVSDEVRRFIDSNLFNPNADTKQDLSFTQVAADDKFLHIRYSPTSGKAKCKLTTSANDDRNGSTGNASSSREEDEDSDPVYSNIGKSCPRTALPSRDSREISFVRRSAGSRAPVCVDDADFAFAVKEFGDNDIATEL